MKSSRLNEGKIVASWHKNARAWAEAVRNGQIATRKQVTDSAIIEALMAVSPQRVLDIGCGEGWLARALDTRGVRVLGIDVVPALIEAARRAGGGAFRVLAYEALGDLRGNVSAESVVCNFSLLGKTDVEAVFKAVPGLLHDNGYFFVQTLHPLIACGDQPYKDGWREGSWAGFSADFTDPAPWYFRTLESWFRLFSDNALRVVGLREPSVDATQRPVSVIFVAQALRGE